MNRASLHFLFARLGGAAIFLAFGAWEVLQPTYWVGYLPTFASHFGDPHLLITIHGVLLFIIGLAFLLNKFVRYAAILGTLMLLQIVVSLMMESGWNEIVVRDLSILLYTASLIFVSR